jgi:hypothetical protein
MGLEAATKALLEAGLTYDAIEVAFVGYVRYNIRCSKIFITDTPHQVFWRFNVWATCTLQPWSDGHSHNECQQRMRKNTPF